MADDDLSEMYRQHKKDKQARHARWNEENMKILKESELDYQIRNMGETVLVRSGKVKADFFPSTGRWLVPPNFQKKYRGGARAFLGWLRDRGVHW